MRIVWTAAAVAVALSIGYALLVSPAFEPYWDDQVAYLRLAHGLVDRGEYTRGAVGAAFVPEPLWPPGYPLFLAPLCVVGCSHWLVAIVQAAFYGMLVVLAHAVARPIVGARSARVVAILVAVYLPIAYWAAIAYSDFLSTVLLTAALAAFLRARTSDSVGWAVASGALLGWLALTRPVYALFPAALLLQALVVDRRVMFTRRRLAPIVALIATFVLVLTPLFVYSERYFGTPFMSSSGAVIWVGAVQGVGRADLDTFEANELATVNAEVATFDRINDRVDQAYAWVVLNASLGVHGLRFIAHDAVGYVARTPLRIFTLWAGDMPVPVDVSRSLDPEVRVAVGATELAILLFALIGTVVLARRRTDAGLLPLVVILYVTLVLAPLGTQPRYSLAAKPLVLTAAVAGFVMVLDRRRARVVAR